MGVLRKRRFRREEFLAENGDDSGEESAEEERDDEKEDSTKPPSTTIKISSTVVVPSLKNGKQFDKAKTIGQDLMKSAPSKLTFFFRLKSCVKILK